MLGSLDRDQSTLMGVANQVTGYQIALIQANPRRSFLIDSQSNANFIELILLNKSFKISTVELEGRASGIFGHFMIAVSGRV